MNRTASIQTWLSFMNRLTKFLPLCGGLILVMGRAGLAAVPAFINSGTINYPVTTNHVPNIDATNFVNFGSFTIDFITVPEDPSLYETQDTMNYTNVGTMDSDTGFQFDNAIPKRQFADDGGKRKQFRKHLLPVNQRSL